MQIRIVGTDLPGRSCTTHLGLPDGYHNIHVAVQGRKPDDLLDPVPGDSVTASWTFDVSVRDGLDLTGPHIQGRRGERFVYLTWISDEGMFRRAKLQLDGVAPEVLAEAVATGVLVGRLGLTDGRREPLCASVRPPVITWSAQ